MTGLDEEFWRWVRENPPETIEQLVLQHVRIKQSKPWLSDRRSAAYIVMLPDGETLFELEVSEKQIYDATFSPAKAITRALLERVICVRCGQRLIEGEQIVCSPCEAVQVMDLVRMQRDLTQE